MMQEKKLILGANKKIRDLIKPQNSINTRLKVNKVRLTCLSVFLTKLDDIQQLVHNLDALRLRAYEIDQQVQQEQKTEDNMHTAIQDIQKLESQLPEKLASLRKNLEECYAKVTAKQQELIQQKRKADAELQATMAQLYPFQQVLGMQFQPEPQQRVVWVLFCNILKDQPEKKFGFCLKFDKDFAITKCVPNVPFENALQQANQTQDFLKLIVNMRELFTKAAATNTGDFL